jgi:hypothetical protein
MTPSRREFLKQGAALLAWGAGGSLVGGANLIDKNSAATQFELHQQARRKELWGILGELPWQHQPAPPQLVKTEKHEGYTLERLVLDLNGLEPVPAILIIPDKRRKPAPGLNRTGDTPPSAVLAKPAWIRNWS